MFPSLRGSSVPPHPLAQPWTVRAAAQMRRLSAPVLVLGALALWWQYGVLGVPPGMDTLPDSHPPGTRCLVEKRPRRTPPGAVVFVDRPDGGVLLARVAAVADGKVTLACANPRSRFASLIDTLGPVAGSAVRALVLVAVPPTPQVAHGQ